MFIGHLWLPFFWLGILKSLSQMAFYFSNLILQTATKELDGFSVYKQGIVI